MKEQLFGNKIKSLRTDKGLSIDQVSEATGIEPASLEDIESSKHVELSIRDMLVLAKFFENSVDDLVSGTEQEELTKLCEKLGKHPSKDQIDEIVNKYIKQ